MLHDSPRNPQDLSTGRFKILLSCPNDGQSNNYIINALQDLGHEVFYVDHRRDLKYAMQYLPDLMKFVNPEVFLCLYLVPGHTYTSEYINKLKAKFPSVKYCSWIFDTTMQGKYCDENPEFINLIKSYDYFFTVARSQVESFRKQGVNAYFAQEGFDPYTLCLNASVQDIDVSFIGQIGHPDVHQERAPLLTKIVKQFPKTMILGPFYKMPDELIPFHAGRPTFNDVEHSKIVGRTKVNIGHSGWTHLDGYFSARNYRIMGSGGFLLANRSKNIEEFFAEEKEIVLYDNPKECVEKIAYYLKHDSERSTIAKAGRKRVFSDYTFMNTLTKILKTINES